jgi:hypothetical protein
MLSLLGGIAISLFGLLRGECVSDCLYSYAEYRPNILIVASGIGAVLISSLIYEVVKLFAFHVENTHS